MPYKEKLKENIAYRKTECPLMGMRCKKEYSHYDFPIIGISVYAI